MGIFAHYLKKQSMTKGLITGFAKWHVVPRALCQYLLIELPVGLSRAQAKSAIALQLNRLDGRSQLEFAYRQPVSGGRQWPVWYWIGELGTAAACPEPLMRQPIARDGLDILVCHDGYELTYNHHGTAIKTRWSAKLPDAQAWQSWLEECGLSDMAQPQARQGQVLRRPLPQWFFHRQAHTSNWGLPQVRHLALTALVGLILGGMVSISFGLHSSTEDLKNKIEILRKDASQAIAQQKQIDAALHEAQVVAAHAPAHRQLEVLGQLAKSGILGGKDKPFLTEWTDQNGRLRMQIAWPPGARLDDFLHAIEQLALFQDIKLMPNPPLGAIVIQAQIKP